MVEEHKHQGPHAPHAHTQREVALPITLFCSSPTTVQFIHTLANEELGRRKND